MMNCLNPHKTHENTAAHTTSTGDSTVVLSGASAIQTPVEVEKQTTCRVCKYLLRGALLGDCRVTRLIGSGAFGDVYEAEQLPPLSRRVAIKVMSTEHVSDGRAVELFAREVSAIAALDHPNILPVLRVGTLSEGRPYLVMKYAAHGSLQKFCPALLSPYSVLPPAIQDSQEDQHQDSMPNLENETLTSDLVLDEIENSSQSAVAAPVVIKAVEASVLTPQQLLPYLEEAAAALQYAHDNGI